MSDIRGSRESTPIPTGPDSPASPIPTPVSAPANPRHYPTQESTSPLLGYHNHRTSRRMQGAQPATSEGLLNEAISRLNIEDKTYEGHSRHKSQDSTGALHERVPHRAQSLDGIHQQGLNQQQSEYDGYDHGMHGSSEYSDTEWNQEESHEEESHEDIARGEPQACLFVASLAATKTDVQLVGSVTDHFKKWGPLLNVKVLKDWMQRPYSFVQFEHVEDAQRAMAEAQNTIIDGRHIRIEQARVNRTLLILRFNRTTTEKDIADVLGRHGPLEDVSIFHDLGPPRNRRYAFAKFAYRDDAIKAFVSLRNDSRWTVEWAPNLSSQGQIEKESIFVGQLNPDVVTETALRELFMDYGEIQYIHLIKRNKPGTNRPTAFAFIEFDNEQAAKNAIDHEASTLFSNNSMFLGTTIRVQYRETSEYRQQRQNAAIQAARCLTMSSPAGAPPVGALPPMLPPHYPDPGIGRPFYYTAYYPYPVSQGMPMAGSGAVPQPRPGSMYAQHNLASCGPTLPHKGSQGSYYGLSTFSGASSHQNASAEQYGIAGQDSGSASYGYDYNTYMPPAEGIYYPHAVPAPIYMYDQGPPMNHIGQMAAPPPVLHTGHHLTSGAPSASSMWYMVSRSRGDTQRRAAAQETSKSTGHYRSPPPRGRSSEEPSPPGGPATDTQNQIRKSA
ncbi:hypothetical protein BGZ51_008080 [Haplosporangium sp. Z 767]|nr:hypothetical protein BGZ51_008080 [Haplosporangium sp. Z 767]KAF9193087.1 hypothetical protein BGZ50_007935 [Haplosporangium sp. Z 11]